MNEKVKKLGEDLTFTNAKADVRKEMVSAFILAVVEACKEVCDKDALAWREEPTASFEDSQTVFALASSSERLAEAIGALGRSLTEKGQ